MSKSLAVVTPLNIAILDRSRTGGAVTLDLEPSHLPIALAEKYLDIKRSGRL